MTPIVEIRSATEEESKNVNWVHRKRRADAPSDLLVQTVSEIEKSESGVATLIYKGDRRWSEAELAGIRLRSGSKKHLGESIQTLTQDNPGGKILKLFVRFLPEDR